jgi:hypothetical protein
MLLVAVVLAVVLTMTRPKVRAQVDERPRDTAA